MEFHLTYIEKDGCRIISPSEGKFLHRGYTYCDTPVYLGKTDSPDNWEEVDEKPDEEFSEDDSEISPEELLSELEAIL